MFAVVARDTFYGGPGDVETDPAAPGFDRAVLDDAIAVSRNQYGTTDDTLHVAELRGQTTLGAHTLITGVQYRYEKVDDRNVDVNGVFVNQLFKDSFDDLGLFVQDEWNLRDNLCIVLGGRVDCSSEVGSAIFSPRVGLWYSPGPSLVLRANVWTGFRAPAVFSEGLHVDTLGGQPIRIRIRNDPSLKEESSVSYAVWFDWQPAFAGSAFSLERQAYYTRITDTLFLGEIMEDVDGTLFRTRTNQDDSTIPVGELTANYRASARLSGSLGISYVDARYDEPQIIFDDDGATLSTSRYLKAPRFGAIGQLLFAPFERLQGFAALRCVDHMRVLNNRTGQIVQTPDFVGADVSLTRHFATAGGRDIDISLGVKNRFDERQRDLEIGATRDSDHVYGPPQARTFFAHLDAAF